MRRILLLLFIIPMITFSQFGYYDGTTGLTGYQLKSKLHEILSRKHHSYNYNNIPDFYATTDLDHYYENNNTILCIYSENPTGTEYEYNLTQNIGSASAEGQGWNREHGMPQSTYYGVYPMYSDLHYLIPTDAFINQKRSNYPYATNNGSNTVFSNGSKLGSSTTTGYSNLVYEPIDTFKGDVARFLLYFITRYEGSLHLFNHQLSTSPLDGTEEKGYENWYITMLLDWHNLDPVSQKEIDRNNAVFAIEKVRNPFIDHPEFVQMIWQQNPNNVVPVAPQNVVVSENGASFLKINWQASTSTDVLGYKIFVNGNYFDSAKSTVYYLDRLSPSTTYQISVKAYDNGYLESASSNSVSGTTLASDPLAKDLMITKYIEGTTSSTTNTYNNAIEITNKTGHPVNLNNYHLSIQYKGANDTYYFSDSYMLEGIIAPGEAKVIIHPYANFADYSINSSDFVTNAPPLTYTGSQYVELSYATKYLKTVSTNNYDLSYTTVDAVGFKNTANTLANTTLYRNVDVTDPNTLFTISEWTSYSYNYTTGLGQDTTLQILNVKNAPQFTVYPNPVKDGLLFVSGPSIKNINNLRIFDSNGRLIQQATSPFVHSNRVDVSYLKTGIYWLQLDQQTIKIIVP